LPIFFLQDFGRKGFDDIVVRPGLDGGDNVLFFRLGGNHQDRKMFQVLVAADRFDELQAGHIGHVPVGNDKIKTSLLQFLKCNRSVFRFCRMFKPELRKQVLDDTAHRGHIVDDQNAHIFFWL